MLDMLLQDFDQDLRDHLLRAAKSDLTHYCKRLCEAWEAKDGKAIVSNQHSLIGICSNFGFAGVQEMVHLDLSQAGERDQLMQCCALSCERLDMITKG